jgi:hypothetical protein
MVSETQRQKLIATFAAVPGVAQAENADRKIELIEAAAAKRATWKFNLYEDVVKAVWNEAASPRWQGTMSWAQRLFERDDFDLEERDYKLELAEAVAEARIALYEHVRTGSISSAVRSGAGRTTSRTTEPTSDSSTGSRSIRPTAARRALEVMWRDPDSEDPRLQPSIPRSGTKRGNRRRRDAGVVRVLPVARC